jgi:hypothetical protein
MTQYIGQITVIIETGTSELASDTLKSLARQLDDTRPEVVFADHNGDVEDYEKTEHECEESLTAPAMTTIDQLLTGIARQHLGMATLDTRSSDRLDFHDVAVWQVQAALKAAFAAGAAESVTTSADLPTRFDAYEIAPCRRLREDGDRDRFYYEPCKPEEADVWTLYGHIPGQGVEAIGDFESCELAEQVYARITGDAYGR